MPDDSDFRVAKRYSITLQAERKRDVEIASIMVDLIMAKNLMTLGMAILQSVPGVKIITKP